MINDKGESTALRKKQCFLFGRMSVTKVIRTVIYLKETGAPFLILYLKKEYRIIDK